MTTGNPYDFRCPTCGAKVDQDCDLPYDDHPELLGHFHAARERLAKPGRARGGNRSVRAIPTAFESNRRRH